MFSVIFLYLCWVRIPFKLDFVLKVRYGCCTRSSGILTAGEPQKVLRVTSVQETMSADAGELSSPLHLFVSHSP